MLTEDLKKMLIQDISKSEDDGLLLEIYRLLGHEEEEVFLFSEKEKDQILKSQSEIKNGNVISENEADSLAEKWLLK